MNIHLIFAMHGEAQHIIQALNLKQKQESSLGFDLYQGQYERHNIQLFVNHKDDQQMDKLGTVQVGLLTYKAIQYQRPDLIINLGTCGGIYDHGVRLLDIVCGQDYIIYHDRFTGDSDGSIKQSLRFSPCITLNKNDEHNFKYGVIASSNSLFVSPYSWKLLYKHKVLCVDMEAAAVAEVAHECGVPLIALKVVTDNVYEVNPVDAFSQFEANFHPAMKHLASKLPAVLDSLTSIPHLSQDKSDHPGTQPHF